MKEFAIEESAGDFYSQIRCNILEPAELQGGKSMNLNDIIHNKMRHKHIPMYISLLSMSRNMC